MSEDDNLDDQVEESNDLEADQVEDNAETSAASEENHEQKIEFSEQQQAHLNKIAANKAYETRAQKRRADDLQDQLNRLQGERQAPLRPTVPDMPDAYEDDYEQRLAFRDESIKQAAIYDSNQQMQANNKAYADRQEEIKEQAEVKDKSDLYRNNAIKQNIDMNSLGVAANQVADYGLDEDVVMEVLADEAGPSITLYLAANPSLIDKLNNASSFQLGALYNDIRAKATGNKKNITNAPEPTNNLSGSGVAPKQRGPAGATFT